MECKLCSKRFSNGKALGGHMRSHFATLPLPAKTPRTEELSEPITDSTSSILSGDERESSGERSSFLSGRYGLREKPKRSFRMIDPDFCDSVVDRESKSEATRVRCKTAKQMSFEEDDREEMPVPEEPLMLELEMDEDVAMCLVMLSKDAWRSSAELTQSRKVYRCEKCVRIFKSPQGLASHRANHHSKKIKKSDDGKLENAFKERFDHGCTICGKVFKSAQALGGHKTSQSLAAKLRTSSVEDHVAAIDPNLSSEIEVEDEGFCSSRC